MSVLLMRGLPGSGKSTYVHKHVAALGEVRTTGSLGRASHGYIVRPPLALGSRGSPYVGASVLVSLHSADLFFGPSYDFDPAKLGAAHAECLRGFVMALERDDDEIIVDNTNISAVELAPYVALCAAYGREVRIVETRAPVEACVARCTHGVPAEVISQMAVQLAAEVLPPYWPSRTVVEVPA